MTVCQVSQKLSPLEDEIIRRPTSHIAKTVTHRVKLSLDSESGQGDNIATCGDQEFSLDTESVSL